MVLLENIQPGEYLIDFLVPNTDRYFKEVLPRKVMINEGEIVKIDQQIKPDSSEKNANHLPESSDSPHTASEAALPSPNLSSSEQLPVPVKEDEKDKNSPSESSESHETVVKNSAPTSQPSSEQVPNSAQVEEKDKNSPPEISESQQTVVENAAPINQSSSEKIPNPVQEDHGSNSEKTDPVTMGTFGKLILSYEVKNTPKVSGRPQIKFRLINSEGLASLHPEMGKDTEVSLNNGQIIMLPEIPNGTYQIEFFLAGNDNLSIHKTTLFQIQSGKTKTIHESLNLPESLILSQRTL